MPVDLPPPQAVFAAFRFGVPDTFVFDDFIKDTVAVDNFKSAVIAELAASLSLAASKIAVTGLKQGSIVATVKIDTAELDTAQ
jgi:hypothetical protein